MTTNGAKAVVFDLDGTLVDSAPDIGDALNVLLAEEGGDALALADIVAMVGDGARAMVERGFAAAGLSVSGRAESLAARYVEIYERNPTRRSRPYPGVGATLAGLAADGYRLGVCTNKPEQLSRTILEGLGLAAHFGAVIGGDSLATRKPDPEPLLATLGRLGVTPGNAVMVGDSRNDVAVARNAAVPVIVVDWGYTPIPAAQLGADAVVDRFDVLPGVIAALVS